MMSDGPQGLHPILAPPSAPPLHLPGAPMVVVRGRPAAAGAARSRAERQRIERYLKSLAPRALRRPCADRAPLSFEQEAVWWDAQRAPDTPLYNEPVTIHHTGPLDSVVLQRALNEFLRRHEAWRTSFRVVEGQPVQWIEPRLELPLEISDLRAWPAAEREQEAGRLATADARQPFDLGQAPLLRARLVWLEDEAQRLYLTLSHLLFDGVSLYRIFLPELTALYAAFAAGRRSPLNEPPWQIGDWAAWERDEQYRQALAPHVEYWRRRLAGELPVLALPADCPEPAARSVGGAMYPFRLGAGLAEQLRALARRERATLFHVLLAGFGACLHRYTQQEDILIGTVTAGRDFPGADKVLGYFLRLVVLRLEVAGELTFRQLLAHVRDVVWEAMEHDAAPFTELLRELRTRRGTGGNSLFRVMFSLEPPLPEIDPAWRLTQMDVETGASKFDLYLEVDDRGDEIWARFHYSTDVFAPDTIARMAAHWQRLLAGACAATEPPIAALPLLTPEEREQMLVAWNRTERPLPAATVPELLAARAATAPRRTAIVTAGRSLSYAALRADSNRLAHYLRRLGVRRDSVVAIGLERSAEMVVALLAVLAAGGAYLPLDPALPTERLGFMLRTARPQVLLTETALCGRWPAGAAHLALLDRDAAEIAAESAEDPTPRPGPGDLAYLLFTSGSTGEPKGVQVEHRSLANLLRAMEHKLGVGPADTLVAVTSLSFDIASMELLLPLIAGGRLVVARAEERADGRTLAALLARSGATLMQATPVTWRMLVAAHWRGGRGFRAICGGEALSGALGRDLLARASEVWNVYGPTETTIWSAAFRLEAAEPEPIPIGRPIANTEFFILDSRREPVPCGAVGELYIGGLGLARGYLHRPDLTAERFIPHPFDPAPGARLYRTGDLCRYRPDGNVEWLGRADQQVKLRGFRIELGEIEAALEHHAAVRAAAVCPVSLPGEHAALAAFFVAEDPHCPPKSEELRIHLRRTLPEYMVPARFQPLPELPQTANGKTDRRALAALLPPPAQAPPAEGGSGESTEIEDQLGEIFSELLGVRPVAASDNFFDLGGYSALALRLFEQIESRFGLRLPLATLFQAGSVADLARIVAQRQAGRGWRPLVAIQTGGARPPFFCFHAADGNVLLYRALAQHLGADQPVFGLQARGLDGEPPLTSIEAMAAAYVPEIRRVQPHGPYYFGGYCGGGTVAFETAQQLRAAGERVGLLALFDTSNWSLAGSPSAGMRLLLSAERIAFHAAN
ncbi:MAG: non-ribosomal peptide synthetase, partial [Terriglobales bacterium]